MQMSAIQVESKSHLADFYRITQMQLRNRMLVYASELPKFNFASHLLAYYQMLLPGPFPITK